jgi:hypothetical protein
MLYDSYHRHSHTMTENRAPTDESIKILREMEEKVKQQVLCGIRLNDTDLDCYLWVEQDRSWDYPEWNIICKINDKQVHAKYTHITKTTLHLFGKYDYKTSVLQGIKKALSEAIADDLLFNSKFELPEKVLQKVDLC